MEHAFGVVINRIDNGSAMDPTVNDACRLQYEQD